MLHFTRGTIVPETESQVRPLTKLKPEQQKEVWDIKIYPWSSFRIFLRLRQ